MSDEPKRKKLNPVYVELAQVSRDFHRAFDRAGAHEEEHGEVDEGKDEEANKAAIELITVVLSHAVMHHPTAVESAYRMVQDHKNRR